MLFSRPSNKAAFETNLLRPTHTGLEATLFFTLTTKLSAVNRSCYLYASSLSLQHGPASLYHELLTIKGFTTALGEGVLMNN